MFLLLTHIYLQCMFTDPKSESRSGTVYLPRDESFGHTKSSDFLAFILKSASQNIIPSLKSVVNKEFNNFEDVRSLYDGGIKLPTNFLSNVSPIPLFTELFRSDGGSTLKFSPPKVVQGIYQSHNPSPINIYIYQRNKVHRSFEIFILSSGSFCMDD